MLIAWLLGVATVLGGLSACLTFLPRPTVVQSDPVDSNNPFSASFTVSNNNFIPLRHMDVYLGIGQIAMEPEKLDPHFIPNFKSRIYNSKWTDQPLGIDERFTVTPADFFECCPGGLKVNGADIAIVVTYKAWILPWRREKIFRFVTHKQSNGVLYWYSAPFE